MMKSNPELSWRGGHTDNVGSPVSTRPYLSKGKVGSYFYCKSGYSADRLSLLDRQDKPIADNNTEEGRPGTESWLVKNKLYGKLLVRGLT